jgi:hypothetical protein
MGTHNLTGLQKLLEHIFLSSQARKNHKKKPLRHRGISPPYSGTVYGLLVDLYQNLIAGAGSCSTHDGADSLGNPALLADDATHIRLCDVQMIYDRTILCRCIHVYANVFGMLDQTLYDRQEQIFQ